MDLSNRPKSAAREKRSGVAGLRMSGKSFPRRGVHESKETQKHLEEIVALADHRKGDYRALGRAKASHRQENSANRGISVPCNLWILLSKKTKPQRKKSCPSKKEGKGKPQSIGGSSGIE